MFRPRTTFRRAAALFVAVLSFATVAQPAGALGSGSTWTTTSSGAGPAEMTDVSCLGTTTTCIAIGYGTSDYGAAIYRSADSGATWTEVPLESGTGPIVNLVCPSNTTCYATGVERGNNQNFLLTSNDGGVTWTYSTLNDFSNVQSIACPGDTTCFAYGYDYQGNLIFDTTTDGGVTWLSQSVPVPTFTGFAFTNPGVVSCPTTTTCYLTFYVDGGNWTKLYIKKTTNAGVSFSSVAVPNANTVKYGGALSCPTVSTCYITDGTNTTSFLDRTTNSGATWSVGASQTVAFGGWFTCIAVDTCVVLANDRNEMLTLTTTDGGATFTTRDLGPRSEFGQYGNLVCSSSTVCIADGMGLGLSIVETTTGGAWSVSNTPSGSMALDNVACNQLTCVAAGPDSLRHSSDGGATWTLSSPVADSSFIESAVVCATSTLCYAAGSVADASGFNVVSSLQVSHDAGASWTPVAHQGLPGNVNKLVCPSATLCFALTGTVFGSIHSFQPQLWRSTDSGATWNQVPLPINHRLIGALTALECPTANTCWLVGMGFGGRIQGSYLMKSVNGGASFSRINMQRFSGVFTQGATCYSAKHCLFVGDTLSVIQDGNVLRGVYTPQGFSTFDGGLSWHAMTLPDTIGQIGVLDHSGSVLKILAVHVDGSGRLKYSVSTSLDNGATWNVDTLTSETNTVWSLTHSSSLWVAVGDSISHGELTLSAP